MSMQRVAPVVSQKIDNYLNNKQTWNNLLFNVKSFGAAGDGRTDDLAAVNRAIAAAEENGGGIIKFPPGVYILSGALTTITTSGIFFEGCGKYATILYHTATTGDLIRYGDAALGPSGVIKGGGVYDLSILHSPSRTSGHTISIQSAQIITVQNVEARNVVKFCVIGDAADTSTIFTVLDDCIVDLLPSGVGIEIVGGANGVHLSKMQINGVQSGTGMRINTDGFGMDTLMMTDCLFQQLNYGIISNGSAGVIQNLFAENCIFDGIQIYSVLINPTSTSIVTRWSFVNCWFTSETSHAVLLGAGTLGYTDGINFTACRWVNIYRVGVKINDANVINWGLYNCILSNCSKEGSGLHPAVDIAANAQKFSIRGGVIGEEGQTQTFQSYAIVMGANCDKYLIEGVRMLGNVTGAIAQGGGTFTKKLISNCLGFNPVGILTPPAVPASATAQANTFPFPVEVIVGPTGMLGVAKNGSNISGVASGSFTLAPGETITLTYSEPVPTWTWFGL